MALKSDTPVPELSPQERREHQRFETSSIAVDYASGDTFLFAYLQNISEMGIFIRTDTPARIGTRLRLRFQVEPGGAGGTGGAGGANANGAAADEPLTLEGEVTWINPVRASGDNLNPGMGVRFIELTPDRREEVVGLVRTVAYLNDDERERQFDDDDAQA